MDKELKEKMREAVDKEFSLHDGNTYGISIEKALGICAEIAAAHYESKWVRVDSEEKPVHRAWIWMMVEGYKDPIKGYYNEAIGVFHAEYHLEYNAGVNTVTHWQYEHVPAPPNSPLNEGEKTEKEL